VLHAPLRKEPVVMTNLSGCLTARTPRWFSEMTDAGKP